MFAGRRRTRFSHASAKYTTRRVQVRRLERSDVTRALISTQIPTVFEWQKHIVRALESTRVLAHAHEYVGEEYM